MSFQWDKFRCSPCYKITLSRKKSVKIMSNITYKFYLQTSVAEKMKSSLIDGPGHLRTSSYSQLQRHIKRHRTKDCWKQQLVRSGQLSTTFDQDNSVLRLIQPIQFLDLFTRAKPLLNPSLKFWGTSKQRGIQYIYLICLYNLITFVNTSIVFIKVLQSR